MSTNRMMFLAQWIKGLFRFKWLYRKQLTKLERCKWAGATIKHGPWGDWPALWCAVAKQLVWAETCDTCPDYETEHRDLPISTEGS